MSLTKKQELFCQEYLVDLNATKAVERAGFNPKSDNTASSCGYDLLRKPEIQARIQELMRARSDRTAITADKVLRQLAAIAFANITDVLSFNEDGITLKDSKTLPDYATAAIQSINSTTTVSHDADGNKKVTTKTSVRMHDNFRALELLAKHTGVAFDLNYALATMRKYGYLVVLDPDTHECFISQQPSHLANSQTS